MIHNDAVRACDSAAASVGYMLLSYGSLIVSVAVLIVLLVICSCCCCRTLVSTHRQWRSQRVGDGSMGAWRGPGPPPKWR